MHTFLPYTYICGQGIHVQIPSTIEILFSDIVFVDKVYSIRLGDGYNNILQNTVFPESLRIFDFGPTFNIPIDDVIFPNSLKKLNFGKMFNHPLKYFTFPPHLTHIIFGEKFTQDFSDIIIPDSVEVLTFEYCSNSIKNLKLPSSLKTINFGAHTQHKFDFNIIVDLSSVYTINIKDISLILFNTINTNGVLKIYVEQHPKYFNHKIIIDILNGSSVEQHYVNLILGPKNIHGESIYEYLVKNETQVCMEKLLEKYECFLVDEINNNTLLMHSCIHKNYSLAH